MPARRPQAELVHRSPGRARLRLRLEEDEQPLLERIAREFGQVSQVTSASPSLQTGSLLILHQGSLEPILERAHAWLELQPTEPRAPMRRLQRAIERATAALSTPDRDGSALSSLTFLALVAAAAHQAARGNLLPAGLPLFGYAMRVMNWSAEREPPLK